MSTIRKIVLGVILVSIFTLMSIVVYKTETSKTAIIKDYELTKKEKETLAKENLENLRVLDSVKEERRIQQSEVEGLKEQVKQLKKEKAFLTELPKKEDVKKIKFNR